MREWFHNSMCLLTSSTGPSRGILKMMPKPKMLQDWQAYHALTYKTKWKPEVDKEWQNYKKKWEKHNLSEKPPKKQFTIMVKFMEKFKNETEEMKLRCKEFRQTHKSGSPVPNNSEVARNLQFQS